MEETESYLSWKVRASQLVWSLLCWLTTAIGEVGLLNSSLLLLQRGKGTFNIEMLSLMVSLIFIWSFGIDYGTKI